MDRDLLTGRNDLFKYKVETVKNSVLNNKAIPEKWKYKEDYNDVIETAMGDPIVLQYSIINSKYHKNRAYPEYSFKKKAIAPRKKLLKVKPLGNLSRKDNGGVKYKIKLNKSERKYDYDNEHEIVFNNYNRCANKSLDFSGKKNKDFLITSILEKELELPHISTEIKY